MSLATRNGLLLCALLLPLAPRAAEPDPLWQKALAIGAANRGLIPRTMREQEKVYTEEGELRRVTISDYEVYRDKDGKVRAKLLRCTRDGRDAYAARKKELDEVRRRRPQDAELFKKKGELFHPDNQGLVRKRRIDIPRTFHGRDAVAFDYSFKGPEATVSGIAWLDAEDGTPYHVVTKPDRFPEHEKFKVHDATIEFLFNDPREENGRWHVETMKVRSQIEVDIFLFFTFKGSVSTEVTFSDFHR